MLHGMLMLEGSPILIRGVPRIYGVSGPSNKSLWYSRSSLVGNLSKCFSIVSTSSNSSPLLTSTSLISSLVSVSTSTSSLSLSSIFLSIGLMVTTLTKWTCLDDEGSLIWIPLLASLVSYLGVVNAWLLRAFNKLPILLVISVCCWLNSVSNLAMRAS